MTNKFGDGISWDKFVIEIIEQIGGDKDKIFFKYEDKKEIIEHIEKYITKGKVLDCGCHIGRWSKLLKERGFDYTGVEQSHIAFITALYYCPKCKFQNKFVWDIDFKEEFDLTFCNNVLQHNTLEEKHKIVPKIRESLKHGGILFLNESTVIKPTITQLTYEKWIELMNIYNFKFIESWQPNQIGLDECYLFRKI